MASDEALAAPVAISDLSVDFPLQAATDGSATAPAYTFSSDPNTGIYSSASDEISLATGGSVALTVDSGRNINLAEDLILTGTGEIKSSAGNLTIDAGGSNSLILQTDDTNALTIDSAQVVSVGTLAVTNGIAGLSGSYTPTISKYVNESAALIQTSYYSVIGDIVHVNVKFLTTATTSNTNSLQITLPVARTDGNFTSAYQASGPGAIAGSSQWVAGYAVSGAERLKIEWYSQSASQNIYCMITYSLVN